MFILIQSKTGACFERGEGMETNGKNEKTGWSSRTFPDFSCRTEFKFPSSENRKSYRFS